VDGYRTRAGTSFYGRSGELARLDRLARTRRLVVVYGPRGAGKGELARYWASKAGWAKVVVVNAYEGRVEGPQGLSDAVEARLAGEAASPLDLVDEALGAAGSSRVAVVIDGIEFLERYRSLPLEAGLGLVASDLQAAATAMSRGGRWRGASLVVTNSSGFIGTLYNRGRLACTTSGYVLLGGLDRESFMGFYREYSSQAGCGLDADAAYRLSGGLPGLAVDLCERGPEGLAEWVEGWLAFLESALASARLDVSRALNWDAGPSGTIKMAARLHGARLKPLASPHEYLLAETLAAHGVAYTRPSSGGVEVTVPYPVVRAALEEASRLGLDSTLDLDHGKLAASLLEARG